jgi:hypothetical protein
MLKKTLDIAKLLILIFLLSSINSINLFSQNWFPLEQGNRWDYSISGICHGGGVFSDTSVVEVIKDSIINGKECFVFSRPFYHFEEKYLRVNNDSLYCFSTQDSIDCLMFVFNKTLNSTYYSCRYDTVFYFDEFFETYFSFPDTQQAHSPFYYLDHIYHFSKKFGLVFAEYIHPLCDYHVYLSGCIISGITYGQLLVSVEGENNSISSFKLEQNFPNPFNTSTQIKYSVVENGLLILKVFDVLGREVTTLVNDEKPPGEYEVEFNGANLTSGIYFYQLKTKDFVNTKKMILLK